MTTGGPLVLSRAVKKRPRKREMPMVWKHPGLTSRSPATNFSSGMVGGLPSMLVSAMSVLPRPASRGRPSTAANELGRKRKTKHPAVKTDLVSARKVFRDEADEKTDTPSN